MPQSDQNPGSDQTRGLQRAAAHSNAGTTLLRSGRLEAALQAFERALALTPDSPGILYNHGSALLALGRPAEAAASLTAALRHMPQFAPALLHRASALRLLERNEEALRDIEQALRLQSPDAITLCNRAGALRELRRLSEALESYDQAIALRPELAVAHSRRADVLLELNRGEEALQGFDYAVRLQPDLAEAHAGRAAVLLRVQRWDEALEALLRVMALQPDYPYVRGLVLHLLMQRAKWERYPELHPGIVQAVSSDQAADEPFSYLALSSSPASQLQCARRYLSDRHLYRGPGLALGRHYGHQRIRVAYLSNDLREHPVTYLLVGVLECHDRERFETIALSLQPAGDSGFARRVRGAFDQFNDVSRQDDGQVAQLMRELEVDIAVDLMGYTWGNRVGILAYRGAPVQVGYLGYPGTMGASFIDYILADEFVIPPALRPQYAEQVVYLPDCFQANDDRRPKGVTPTRAQAGLPAVGPVLCCFNNTYKINPAMFDIWCRVLAGTPQSVLWLLADRPEVSERLRQEAAVRGVDPQRLIMAPRLPYPEHLGRFALADLFLDTLPFNAGATASDALWAGVPVLTCAGEAFAARMAGSLLRAVGLPGLICSDLADYERRALALARDPAELARLKGELAARRTGAPLFDSQRFCRHLEAAYETMQQRAQRGAVPESFAVAARTD